MMAIHVIAFNCLLHNPEAFTEQSVKNNSTDALRTHPTKQAVNQYLIDSILQKRRTVQRTENLWDRSLYNAATDTPPKQRETTRHHRLDNEEEDESTPGTSCSSSTSKRHVSSLPDFDQPPPPSAKSPAAKRPRLDNRKPSPFSALAEDADDDAEPTHLYARASADRRSETIERRTATRNLATSFDDGDDEVHQQRPAKKKRPLVGPPTAKNKVARKAHNTTDSNSEGGDDHPPPKQKTDLKPAGKLAKSRQLSSPATGLDDDQLGITPRTPPQSPFYRGPTNRIAAAGTAKKNSGPSTSTAHNRDRNANSKQVSASLKAPEQPQEATRKKKKNRKSRGGLEDPAQQEDKLYAQLNKTT